MAASSWGLREQLRPLLPVRSARLAWGRRPGAVALGYAFLLFGCLVLVVERLDRMGAGLA